MAILKNSKILHLWLAILFIILLGCAKNEEQASSSRQGKYSIYIMAENGDEYIASTNSLETGKMDIEKSGTSVNPQRIFYDLMVDKGFYYRLDGKTREFLKISTEGKSFKTISKLKLKNVSVVDNYNWVTPDTLMLIGFDEGTKKVGFAKIHVANMQAREGFLPLVPPSGAFNWMSVGFSHLANGKLHIGYTYHAVRDLSGYSTSDTMYVQTLAYPGLQPEYLYKDSRTTYPGGVNTRQSHYFTDEKGDFYFITCPGIALGNNPSKPTTIMRIGKNGKVDPDYFFNISASKIGNNGYGFWYIGNGKAIVRTERKGVFSGMNDHYKVPHFDFYQINLQTKTTQRLNLPLDKGTARNCIIIENGLVYIAVNSDTAGNFIWIYNPAKNTLRKGLQLTGNTDYILRIEQLN